MKNALIIKAQGETLQGLQSTLAAVLSDIDMNYEFPNRNFSLSAQSEKYSLCLQDMTLSDGKSFDLLASLKPIPTHHTSHHSEISTNHEYLAKENLGLDFVKLLQGIIDGLPPQSSKFRG